MTPWVQTPHGLMPAYAADVVAGQKSASAQIAEDLYREDLDRRCSALGVKMAEVERQLPDGKALIQRAMRKAVDGIPRHVLEARYPCAACRVISDDTYRATCAKTKTQPCFVKVRLKGCPFIQPRLVISRHIPTAAAKK